MNLRQAALLSLPIVFAFASGLPGQESAKPLKVFVLAGQSNMEGKGSVVVLNHQLTLPEKAERFSQYKSDETFIERDDVCIDYLGSRGRRHGPLTTGYGISQDGSVELFGPELGFGWVVGDHFEEKVLIIKTAWGGKSIDKDFRPPSRGLPDSFEEQFEKAVAKAAKKDKDLTRDEFNEGYGHYYRLMMAEIQEVTSDLKTYVPDYDEDAGYEIAGFVWFQGWNDQYAPTSVEDYQDNLIGLIKDIREELGTPELPVVIGAMGHNGSAQKGKIKLIADAQFAVAQCPEFQGTVLTIETARFWDMEAQAAYEKHWADEPNRDIEKWREFGDDRGYHYFGSPWFFSEAGKAFGEAMIGLQK